MPPKSISPWLDTVDDHRRFPALRGWVTADVAVIGGGIAGLMTAWNLAAKGRSVVILEKNRVATGDTGLTTAFLTRVPDAGAADLLRAHDSAWLTRVFAATADAQRWFKDLVRREAIDCDLVDCVSWNCSYESSDPSLLSEWNAVKQASAGATLVPEADVARCGVSAARSAMVFDHEARFHIRKFVFGLLARPTAKRIQIFEETEVVRIETGDAVVVQTSAGSVLCRSVVCATGRPIDALSECRELVKPVLTFVVAARYPNAAPMSDNLFWDCEEPYHYFRLLDSRTVILGGSDRPADEAANGSPHGELKTFLDAKLPGPYESIYEWSGTMFDTVDGLPYIAEHPHYQGRVFVATGFGGNGMVMGAMAGRILADLVTRTANAHADLFEFARTGVKIATPDQARQAAASSGPAAFVTAMPVTDLTDKPRAVNVKGRDIAFFRIGGSIYAIDNACSHAGGPLCDGPLEGTVVTCPWHRSRFDVTTGSVRQGPASQPQRSYKVRVSGSAIEVEV
jgi:glycine/D-amino acid oxidase-like deaminating enzyme/nitrite reductase/ring-hydroxylating ferredoxin subunit